GRVAAPWPARTAAATTGSLPPGTAIIIAATSASVILPRHHVSFGSALTLRTYIGKRPARSMRAGHPALIHFDAVAGLVPGGRRHLRQVHHHPLLGRDG